jgi:hypothetical protein
LQNQKILSGYQKAFLYIYKRNMKIMKHNIAIIMRKIKNSAPSLHLQRKWRKPLACLGPMIRGFQAK